MFDNARVLDLIERALDDRPFCEVCAAPTTVADTGNGRLWLVCSATEAPLGVAGRVSAALLPHTRRRLIDLSEHIAA